MRINRPKSRTKPMPKMRGTATRDSRMRDPSTSNRINTFAMATTPVQFTLDRMYGSEITLSPNFPIGSVQGHQSPPKTAHQWVVRNPKKLEKHIGKWVAVTNKGVITSSLDFDDVFRKAKAKGVVNPLVFKVPRKTQRPRVVSTRARA